MADTSSCNVTFDSRSLIIDGKRSLLISGEIHYPRVPVAEWGRVLDLSRKAGLNCVASYVFWNVHEPQPDVYHFTEQADLGAYLETCQAHGLDVILRIGPYCCAEWNYGGFPPWLRDIPGITIRTWNEPYIERVKRYFRILIAKILPQLKTRGGPVILVQVENEYNNVSRRYGADGEKYLAWIVDYVKSLGIDVPIVTCEGRAPGAIQAVNGFNVRNSAQQMKKEHPCLPLLWTENWPGWYQTWGFERPVRDGNEIGYEILHFLRLGGAGFNYYMWHGGTNFGRTAMYLQTTGYEFGGPLNEWGEPTAKYHILQNLHRAILDHQEALLEGERHEEMRGVDGGTVITTWQTDKDAFRITFNLSPEPREIQFDSAPHLLHPPASAVAWYREGNAWRIAWKSYPDALEQKDDAVQSPWKPLPNPGTWLSWTEPQPIERADGIESATPLQQLSLTHDKTDYCWYSSEVMAPAARQATLNIARGGDFFHIFVNGILVSSTQGPLQENRGPIAPAPEIPVLANQLEEKWFKSSSHGYGHTFVIPLKQGINRIEILACALGMIKGDWQICMSMDHERKGIWGDVTLDGKKITPWRMHPWLEGEKLGLPATGPGALPPVAWETITSPRPLTWHRMDFKLSPDQLAPDLAWAFDAKGLNKGFLWVNGLGLGRFWQFPANFGKGADGIWQPPAITSTGKGEPTQRYYRIPASWLKKENNLLVFSETGEKPANDALVFRKFNL